MSKIGLREIPVPMLLLLAFLLLLGACERKEMSAGVQKRARDTVVYGVAQPKAWNDSARAFYVPSLRDRDVLSVLFESDSFVDSTREIVWRPDTEERTKFNVSDDGNVYTSLDTILYWANRALVITKTRGVWFERGERRGYTNCCACGVNYSAALFTKDGSRWQLNIFQKIFFDGGENGDDSSTFRIDAYGITEYGHRRKCLVYRKPWIHEGHGGYWVGIERIFSIEEGPERYHLSDRISPLLTYEYGVQDATGYVEEYVRVSDARFVKKAGYFDIVIDSKTTKTAELYVYDENAERYVRKH